MTRKQEWNLYWECTMGKKSHINAIGKIIFFPLAVFFACIYFGMDVLFCKSE